MIITWHNDKVPEGIKIKQVYGLLFMKDGRMLLRIEDGFHSLAGGKPELGEDISATLRREVIEEVNTTIYNPIYLGYQLVDEENGKEPYAQVRMIAMIDTIGECLPDPDNGKTYQRLLTCPSKVIEYLNWGEVGKLMIESSVELAKEKFGLNSFLDKDEMV